MTREGATSGESRWERVTQINTSPLGETTPILTRGPFHVGHCHQKSSDNNEYIQLDACIVLRMSFTNDKKTRKKYFEVIDRGKDCGLVRKLYPNQLLVPTKNTKPLHHHPIHHDPNDVEAGFIKYYALQSCVTRYLLNECQLDNPFYKQYADLDPDKVTQLLQDFLATKERGDHGHRKTLAGILESVNSKYTSPDQKQKEVSSSPKNKEKQPQVQRQQQKNRLVKVNKVSVTPTSIRLEHPKIETANRVLRHFKAQLNRFLRVQFIDENGSRIFNSHKPLHDHSPLYRRIMHVLQCGIDIHGRHYTFLAFSSSQLREHGCWFFSNTEELTTYEELAVYEELTAGKEVTVNTRLTGNIIRAWMGDFSSDNVVAKYAARMGQCFSSTEEVGNINPEETIIIPDIKHNGCTFSDGVGLISKDMAKNVITRSHRGYTHPLASAFQVRLGGAKGMLTVVSNRNRERLLEKDKKIALRESQIKFESKHEKLEIIRSASSSVTYLNRQVILLLSTLGVPDEIFLILLNSMKAKLDKVLTDTIYCAAMLRANRDEFGIYTNMARLVDAGFLEAKDPYITNLIEVFRASKLKEAKKKARIHVPDAISVMGVLDETDTLKENQIFCQLSTRKKNNRVIKGPCILYRCPSLHPGDIRMVEAVDCPHLHDLYDVVVFPQQGKRSLPSMCSGGDLDGDIYSIIWDSRLFPVTQDTEPMYHNPVDSPKVDGVVTINDIMRFFVDYIKNDNLGQIAHAHLAIADRSDQNAFDPICISLAKRHSVAVDFPKTGQPAKFKTRDRPRKYPDFMEKADKPTYESPKILGQLYRDIDATKFEDYHEKLELDTKYDTRMFVQGMEKYIRLARGLKRQYDQELRELMNQYGIATESELMSGSIVKWLKREDGPVKLHDTRYEVRREVTRLRDVWRRDYFPILSSGGKSKSRDRRKLITRAEDEETRKAAAFYYVTYHPEEPKPEQKTERMLSFPWLAQEILCRLARVNQSSEKNADAIPELLIWNSSRSSNKSTITATISVVDEAIDIPTNSTASSTTSE